ncbi:MAG: iron-sulfur cluster assembly accessory protein [Acidobacteriota bacterium]|nr:iron-sulfur cluster assembly accessory protein [Acidobacteriota bacterium]
MVTISDLAKQKIKALIEEEENASLALRIAIRGRGPNGFNYDLGFVEDSDKEADDRVVDGGGFQVFIDKDSAPNLEGATLDFVDGAYESGFKIENPNPLWSDPTALKIQEVIDNRINPGVASHGGWVALLDVKNDTAFIQLGGGCQGCGMVDVTLKQGIEVMIKEAVPEVTKIIDTTDHAGGQNPFYQPAKGGGPSAIG